MNSKRDAVVVSMARSAIGDFGGSLKNVRAYDLAAQVAEEVLRRAPGFDPAHLDDVMLGDCMQNPDEATTARTVLLKAGIPVHVPGVTIQRQCASAMQALAYAVSTIRAGDNDVVLAGGVESMSNAVYYSPDTRWGARLRHTGMQDSMWDKLHSGSCLLDPPGYIMGQTAENLAEKYQISREDQDEIALRSNHNAEAAITSGAFAQEIVPIKVPGRKGKVTEFAQDEHVRMGLKMEDLARLKPVFRKNGTVTAGNASGLNDGAALCLVMAREKAQDYGLPVLARLSAYTAVGCEPSLMGWGPVPATQKLLARTGVALDDIQLIELNEAFAAQYLACERGLGINREITNVNGSGVGLGHPVGCTGARIVVSLISEMRRRGNTLGLATLCIGGGMGMAMLVETE